MFIEDEVRYRYASPGDDGATISSSLSPTLTDASTAPTDYSTPSMTTPSPPPVYPVDMHNQRQRYYQANPAVTPYGQKELSPYLPFSPPTPSSPQFPPLAVSLASPTFHDVDHHHHHGGYAVHNPMQKDNHRGMPVPHGQGAKHWQHAPPSPGPRQQNKSHLKPFMPPNLKPSHSASHLYSHYHEERTRGHDVFSPSPLPLSPSSPTSHQNISQNAHNFRNMTAVRSSVHSIVTASEINMSLNAKDNRRSDITDDAASFSVDDAIEMYLDGFSDDPPKSPGGDQDRGDNDLSDTTFDDRTDISDPERSTLDNDNDNDNAEMPDNWPLSATPQQEGHFELLPETRPSSEVEPVKDGEAAQGIRFELSSPTEGKNTLAPLASNPVLSPPPDTPRTKARFSSVMSQKPCERLELPHNFPITSPPPLTKGTSTRDRYGFLKSSTAGVTDADYDAWSKHYAPYMESRKKKWETLLEDHGCSKTNPTTFPPKSSKVKRFVRKGIPPEFRGHAWFCYSGGDKAYHQNPGLYRRLVEEAWNSPMNDDKEHIERDLHRTFPDNIHFKPEPVDRGDGEQGEGGSNSPDPYAQSEPEPQIIQSLRRVLYAFALHNSKIGYTQSLNFIAGMLLLLLPEEKAFWMLHIITCHYLPATHEISLEGANVDLWILMVLLKEQIPNVYTKVASSTPTTSKSKPPAINTKTRLPDITLGLTNWLMSLFIGSLPLETTLRIWDVFFYEGSRTFFRVGLGIFKSCEKSILSVSDPMEIFLIVQMAPKKLLDANTFVDDCFARKHHRLSQQRVEYLRDARRRAIHAEKERLSIAGQNLASPASDDYRPRTGHAWRSFKNHAFRA